MKKLILVAGMLVLAASAYSLPLYDDFSSYGTPGTWTQVSGPPIVSYTTGAPWLGGTTAPTGESWLLYTNAPPSDLYSNYYSGDFTGFDRQNVAIVNYFGIGQPGASDTAPPTLPSGFPGPFVSGHDTRTNSLWTPGWSQTGEVSPELQSYLGGVGACLQFANVIPATTGNKVFVSFFVDIPDCTGSFGAGQSLLHGYTAGFLNSAELPNIPANQFGMPGFSQAGYANIPLMAKFNMRDNNTTSWKPGTGFVDSNGNSAGTVNQKTIHFIVMSYEFNGGASLDKIALWLDTPAANFGANAEPASTSTSSTPTSGFNLPDVGGFFFLANTQDGGATPNSGVFFNSLRIATNWAYVTGGAQFVSQPANTTIVAGNTTKFGGLATAGGLTVSYQWQTNGVNVTDGGRFSGSTTGTLTISNSQPSDAGVSYTLIANTPVSLANGFSVTSSVATVAIISSATVLGNGNAQITYTGFTGAPYRLWSTTNLMHTNVTSTWTLLQTSTFTGSSTSYTDTTAPAISAQYYTITQP